MFHHRVLFPPDPGEHHILIHGHIWIPHRVYITTQALKSLGEEYSINVGDSTSLQLSSKKFWCPSKRSPSRRPRHSCYKRVPHEVSPQSRDIRWGALGAVPAQCDELDHFFASEIRRRNKNMKSSHTENIFFKRQTQGAKDISKYRASCSRGRDHASIVFSTS